MTKSQAIALLDKWSAQPMIRRIAPLISRAIRLVIGKPALPVGVKAVPLEYGWRDKD